jgi:O-antigen/teichoic acid export membrane protein
VIVNHALKWSFAAEVASKVIQPLVFLFLARILTPEDFGVMTAAMMVITLSQMFWEAGMGKALIQRQTDVVQAANAAFILNITLGATIATTLYCCAPIIAQTFFKDTRVAQVLRIMTLQVLLGAISSVHNALIQKEMGFKKLFFVRFAAATTPGIASLPIALYGYGYWALVVGTLSGQLVQTVMLWKISTWRPTKYFTPKVTYEIAKFGGWVALSGLLGWFFVWVDSLFVGMYLGSYDLGLYRTGNQLVASGFGMVTAPALPVIYSRIVLQSNSPGGLCFFYNDVINSLMLIGVVFGVVIWINGELIAELAFSNQWAGVGSVISFFGLIHGFASIVAANGEFYRAASAPQKETFAISLSIPIYLVVYKLVISNGLLAFMWARFLLVFVGIAGHLYLASKSFEFQKGRFIRNLASMIFVSLLTTYLVNNFKAMEGVGSFYKIVVNTMVALICFLVLIIILMRDELNAFSRLISRMAGNPK